MTMMKALYLDYSQELTTTTNVFKKVAIFREPKLDQNRLLTGFCMYNVYRPGKCFCNLLGPDFRVM